MAATMAAGAATKAAGKAASKVPPVVPWAFATVGVWLVYTAVTGRKPLEELRAALTGRPSPGPTRASYGGSLTGGAPAATPAAIARPGGTAPVSGPVTGSTSPTLVPIGQGGHRLAPDAADGFARWVSAFGGPIPVTDSYRDYATQKAAHEKDPGRFGSPDKSAHPKGKAVDVNLTAIPGMRAPSRGKDDGNAVWQRLYSSAVATGWCNARGGPRGDGREPWHFSYGGCA